MIYQWDDKKSGSNRLKHGITFDCMLDFNWGFAVLKDVQISENEERQVWIGPIEDRLHVVVTTERANAMRIISLRRAERAEIDDWKQEFQNG